MTDEHRKLEDLFYGASALAERALYGEHPKNGELADWASDAFWEITEAIAQHEAWKGDPWPDHPAPYDRLTDMRKLRESVRLLLCAEPFEHPCESRREQCEDKFLDMAIELWLAGWESETPCAAWQAVEGIAGWHWRRPPRGKRRLGKRYLSTFEAHRALMRGKAADAKRRTAAGKSFRIDATGLKGRGL